MFVSVAPLKGIVTVPLVGSVSVGSISMHTSYDELIIQTWMGKREDLEILLDKKIRTLFM
jgi:hypothetical protein